MLYPGLESTGSNKPKQFALLPNFSASLMFYCTLGAPKTKRVNTLFPIHSDHQALPRILLIPLLSSGMPVFSRPEFGKQNKTKNITIYVY